MNGQRAVTWLDLPDVAPVAVVLTSQFSGSGRSWATVSRGYLEAAGPVLGVSFCDEFREPSCDWVAEERRAGAVDRQLEENEKRRVRERENHRNRGTLAVFRWSSNEASDAEFLAAIPTAAASRIRYVNFRLFMPYPFFPPLSRLHVEDFGARFADLRVVHVVITASNTNPPDSNCLALALVRLVSHTRATLEELDVDARVYFEFSDCLELIRNLGPALTKLRLNHHPWSPGGRMLDRSATLRAELARALPQFPIATAHLTSVLRTHFQSEGWDYSAWSQPPIIADAYTYMEDRPFQLLPQHRARRPGPGSGHQS